MKTEQYVLAPDDGARPPEAVDALEQRLREKEREAVSQAERWGRVIIDGLSANDYEIAKAAASWARQAIEWREIADYLVALRGECDRLKEQLADTCACQHDGRGSLVSECQEHQEIREERDKLRAARRINELDNHHNAARCPYCMPTLEADAQRNHELREEVASLSTRLREAEQERDELKAFRDEHVDAYSGDPAKYIAYLERQAQSRRPAIVSQGAIDALNMTGRELSELDDLLETPLDGTDEEAHAFRKQFVARAQAADATLAQVREALKAASKRAHIAEQESRHRGEFHDVKWANCGDPDCTADRAALTLPVPRDKECR